MDKVRESRANPGTWTSFGVNLTLVIVMFVSAVYTGIFFSNRNAIESELRHRGSAIFNSIVLTRKWNAGYGGVYVEKKPGVASNAYLKNPDIRTADGKVYTLKNPALMTREIADIASAQGEFKYHITSRRPVNPANAPDEWEQSALEAFETGVGEAYGRYSEAGAFWYRYMAPLRFEGACAQCHDGYRVGDIRGGISVRFNIDAVETALSANRDVTIALFMVSIVTLFLVIYRLVIKLYRRLKVAEDRIYTMAITDELTGVCNRRQLLERLAEEVARARRYRRGLACIMLDLDHFKRVNDTHGHAAGDAVLRAAAAAVSERIRATDFVGRYGGEEFVVVLPETSLAAATLIAEKLRGEVESLAIDIGEARTLRTTASLGVAYFDPAAGAEGAQPDTEAIALVQHADAAMYRAKRSGRNRVEVADGG
jgi:diguanylate cyclase (GGDEF)-like protein